MKENYWMRNKANRQKTLHQIWTACRWSFRQLAEKVGLGLLVSLLFSINVNAQKKRHRTSKTDTLATARLFIEVCNVYKQLPLYLDLEMINTTNFVITTEDTSRSRAEFYMIPGSSYIRFGEVEQIANDSMALLVSNKIQKMILYSNAQPIISRMKMMMGVQLPDSSLLEIAKKFKAEQKQMNDTAVIELTNRLPLPGTSLSKEKIEVLYDAKTKNPFRVKTIRRTLIPLMQEEYNDLKSRPGMAGRLVQIEEKGYFLVKEQSASFIYKTINHESVKLPATIMNRIVKSNEGIYEPVKGYEAYQLIKN